MTLRGRPWGITFYTEGRPFRCKCLGGTRRWDMGIGKRWSLTCASMCKRAAKLVVTKSKGCICILLWTLLPSYDFYSRWCKISSEKPLAGVERAHTLHFLCAWLFGDTIYQKINPLRALPWASDSDTGLPALPMHVFFFQCNWYHADNGWLDRRRCATWASLHAGPMSTMLVVASDTNPDYAGWVMPPIFNRTRLVDVYARCLRLSAISRQFAFDVELLGSGTCSRELFSWSFHP